MNSFGYEHLKFNTHTYRQRQFMLILASLCVLFFEYHVAQNISLYGAIIPGSLIQFALLIATAWTTFQFIFAAVDDFIGWKSAFLIDKKTRLVGSVGDNSLLVQLESFSHGQIKFKPSLGLPAVNTESTTLTKQQAEHFLDHAAKDLEKRLKAEIASIEAFNHWYRNYSWFTVARFSIVEFGLPLAFTLYATIICRLWPLLPK